MTMTVALSGTGFKIGDRVSWPAGDGTEFLGRICQIHGKKATVMRENHSGKVQVKLCHLFPISPRTDFKVGDAVAHKHFPNKYYGNIYGFSGGDRVLLELDGNKITCFSSSLVPFTGKVPVRDRSLSEYRFFLFVRHNDQNYYYLNSGEFGMGLFSDRKFYNALGIKAAKYQLQHHAQFKKGAEFFGCSIQIEENLPKVASIVGVPVPEKLPILEAIAQVEAIAEAPPAISRGKSKASGWLENYVVVKRSEKSGNVGFPRVPGDDRDPLNISHWYWRYRYEEKSKEATSKNGHITRAVAVSQHKVKRVQEAIKDGKIVVEILDLIKG